MLLGRAALGATRFLSAASVDASEGSSSVATTGRTGGVYSLYLTPRGGHAMADIGQVARAHNQALCAALSAEEREQLGGLLERIADQRHLMPGVHPGFRQLVW